MGHKILLADDSITVQKIVKLTFSDEGVEVVAVGNGELALQQLADWQPDLIMADVFMPGRDGYEVCEYVKTSPDLCHIPVILLVHAFEPFDQARATQVKADRHLTKPFHSIRTLVTTVRELIQTTPATSVDLPSAPAFLTTAAPATQAPPSPAFSPAPDPSFSAEPSFPEVTQEFGQQTAADHSPISFETVPLTMSAYSASGFGEVTALRPQSEPEKNEISFASLQTPSVQEPPFPVNDSLMPTGGADYAESGQLLSFSDPGNFGQGYSHEAVVPESLPEPESLNLMPETAPPVAPLGFSQAVMDYSVSVTAPSSEPVAPLMQVAEGTVSSFIASRASADTAPGEVLELDEFLPPVPTAQSGDTDLFGEPPLPPMNGFGVEPELPAFGFNASEAHGSESEVLPILADVADEGRTKPGAAFFADTAGSNEFAAAQPSLPPPAISFGEPAFEDVSFPLSSFVDAPGSHLTTAPAEVASTFKSGFASEPTAAMFPDFSSEKTAAAAPTLAPSTDVFPTEAHNYEFGQSRDFGMGQVLEEPTGDHSALNSALNSELSIEQTALFADEPEPTQISEVAPAASFIVPAVAASMTLATLAATSETQAEPGEKQDHGVGVAAHKLSSSEPTAHSISPALIDEIVNRVVARLSEKAIQEIAWEVVPEMAELIIRKHLAEKSR